MNILESNLEIIDILDHLKNLSTSLDVIFKSIERIVENYNVKADLLMERNKKKKVNKISEVNLSKVRRSSYYMKDFSKKVKDYNDLKISIKLMTEKLQEE